MKQKIINKLKQIEQDKKIKILLAVESGSRGWDFASKDSDFDVRFIYIHKLNWYLSIERKRDVLEFLIIDLLDINGWDIRKILQLFRKSNPPLLEWLQSPIIYLEQTGFAKKLREFSQEYFSPKSAIYHYLNMAKGNFREYLQKDIVWIKKYFYVLRPVLACDWIDRTNTKPPIEFEILLNEQIPESELKTEIQKLLKRKRAGDELDKEPNIQVINDFLKEKIEYFDNQVKKYETDKHPGTNILDKLFLETLDEVWKNT